MTTTLDLGDIADREPFLPAAVVTGSTFERARLRDGRGVVLKHLPAEGSWLSRLMKGSGRARALWDGGVLERVSAHVDQPVVAMRREDDHDIVVMEDVSASLVPWEGRVPRSIVDQLLGGLVELHQGLENHDFAGLCSPAERVMISSPTFHREDTGPNPCPFGMVLAEGWEQFAERVPDDVVGAIFAVLDDPSGLGAQLEVAAPQTLLHGDAKLNNMGLRDDGRLVLIDWGEVTGTGPAEMDVVWFVATSTFWMPGSITWAVDALPDELFAVYEARAGRPLDSRALDLACIGILAQCGSLLAVSAMAGPDEATCARAAEILDWWVTRVRRALDTWSPT
jgi:hypothetical protein